ncbi:hypothetical protein NFI96_012555 [Prochilodus magdalenae]|nr:hypothetical protein NFI96_012555 [Prochilodus magdalenae]
MELPNYSRQLMQQLQALRKEQQFCDCSILVEGALHPAHKVVLAASSQLFKSLLESTDRISIDMAVVTSQEFCSLLDMAYTGRLPLGKHNFSRIIAAADSLQMFDVAVGCKNILNDLVKQTHSPPDCPGGPEDRGKDVETKNADDLKGNTEGSSSRLESPNVDGTSEEGAGDLLPRKRDEILQILRDVRPWIKSLGTWDAIPAAQRQILLECFEGDPGADVVLPRLLDQMKAQCDLSAQAFLTLLDQLQRLKQDLDAVLVEQQGAELKGNSSGVGTSSSGCLDKQGLKLTEYLTSVNDLSELLMRAADKCRNEALKEVLLECSGELRHGQVVKRLLSVLSESGLEESSLLKLLEEARKTSELNQSEESQSTGSKTLEDYSGSSLLETFRKKLGELNLPPQLLSLKGGPTIPPDQRECIQGLLDVSEGDGAMDRLLGAALNDSPVQTLTVWRLLLWAGDLDPELGVLVQEISQNPAAMTLVHTVAQADVLFKHRALILETFSSITDLEGAAGCQDWDEGHVTEFLQSCRGSDGVAESMEMVLDRVLSRDLQHIRPLCCLLTTSQKSSPRLLPLIEELQRAEPEPAVPSQAAASEEGEEQQEEEEEVERSKTGMRRKGVVVSYTCQWCNKSFDFKCRLVRHRKRCALSPGKVQRCLDCSLHFPSLTALQQHRSKAHGDPPAKKRKTEPVACDLCSKIFKHPSGLMYHRRTEHLEERPYVCEECGAKFAANSSLKNHMRLHTGEKPFHCKHCDMSFAVAAALSYHTKKKHAEGKMYSCQYCSSTFAQSIELTRHVRTHTGDKPYVCRECGKGFKQAHGLSVHLQSFHKFAEPHDCQKCRVSFGSLDELREHIQEVHPKELHQCPECSRILSTAAQLEKHMSTHDGSKPYSCKSCHKSYQTLSGLWYHNRTTHPDVVTSEGSRPLSILLRCKICDKAFCNRSSLFKHHITKHPELHPPAEGPDRKEAQGEVSLWRCPCCPCAASSEQELQQHVSSEHVSQQGSVFGCVVCSLTFPSEPEFQHHFLTSHLQVIQEEESTQMVIQTQDTSAEGVEQTKEMDQSQLPGSQQVFVALGDGGESAAGSEIVAVNVEDLLAGRIALVCEENP